MKNAYVDNVSKLFQYIFLIFICELILSQILSQISYIYGWRVAFHTVCTSVKMNEMNSPFGKRLSVPCVKHQNSPPPHNRTTATAPPSPENPIWTFAKSLVPISTSVQVILWTWHSHTQKFLSTESAVTLKDHNRGNLTVQNRILVRIISYISL